MNKLLLVMVVGLMLVGCATTEGTYAHWGSPSTVDVEKIDSCNHIDTFDIATIEF